MPTPNLGPSEEFMAGVRYRHTRHNRVMEQLFIKEPPLTGGLLTGGRTIVEVCAALAIEYPPREVRGVIADMLNLHEAYCVNPDAPESDQRYRMMPC